MAESRKTPLYEQHLAANARIIDFHGWYLPVQYTSIIQEHQFVRKAVGMFDLSHMGEIVVSGVNALDLLQYVTCNDISTIKDGQVQYNVILNNDGGLIDDVTIYRVQQDEYFVVSNAANYDRVAAHLESYRSKKNFDCTIDNQSDNWALIAIQGPKANQFMVSEFNSQVDDIIYYRFTDFHEGKSLLRISRTGYTGEDGFEIYCDATSAQQLWERFIKKNDQLLPIGLGARDSLRLEVFYPLYGNELNDQLTPIECNLKWIVKDKSCDYLAKQKLLQQKQEGIQQRVVGFTLPKGALARNGYTVFAPKTNTKIGQVLSGLYSPTLGHGIGSALVTAEYAKKGGKLAIQIRENLVVEADVHFGGFVSGSARKN